MDDKYIYGMLNATWNTICRNLNTISDNLDYIIKNSASALSINDSSDCKSKIETLKTSVDTQIKNLNDKILPETHSKAMGG